MLTNWQPAGYRLKEVAQPGSRRTLRELVRKAVHQQHNRLPGLSSLPKKIVDRIKANDYVDFAELPPAKGKGKLVTQPGEGQIIVL